MFFIAYILRYRIIDSGGGGVVEFFNYFATLASSGLIFQGSIMFLEVKISRYWVLNLAVAVVWYIVMFFSDAPTPLSTLYGVVLVCVLYIRVGKLFMKTMLIKGSIKYVLGVTFILWGCSVGLSPLFLGRGMDILP